MNSWHKFRHLWNFCAAIIAIASFDFGSFNHVEPIKIIVVMTMLIAVKL